MCNTCGCSTDVHDHDHHHDHTHADPGHQHAPGAAGTAGTVVSIEQKVLARNQLLAEQNRRWFAEHRILALNLVSSPGSGKTTLLERTIRDLGSEVVIRVIEGDQATDHDARRIEAAGSRVVQINTGAGCHLDASMIARALEQLEPPPCSVVMIENVGNLVCPALFDLGEHAKVLIGSVTEGDDKPAKYPHMFRASSLLLLNKTDLLPHVDFDRERFVKLARQVNPASQVVPISAKHGDGLSDWYSWVRRQREVYS